MSSLTTDSSIHDGSNLEDQFLLGSQKGEQEDIATILSQPIVRNDSSLKEPVDFLSSKESFNGQLKDLLNLPEGLGIDFTGDFDDLSDYINSQNGILVLKDFALNRAEFVQEIFSHLQSDIQELSGKFSFDVKHVDNISIKSLGADTHKGGKSTVLLKFNMKDGSLKEIFYKPREMGLEKTICGKNGLLDQLGDLIGAKFSTFEVMNQSSDYGYAEKVGGQVLYDEGTNETSQDKSTAEFMALGVKDDFEAWEKKWKEGFELVEPFKNYRDEFKGIEEDVHAIWDILSDSKEEELSKFCSEFGNDKEAFEAWSLSGLKFLTAVLKNNDDCLKELFFHGRTDEQLKKDHALFTLLHHLGLDDLHAGNFIFSLNENNEIVLIDAECASSPEEKSSPLKQIEFVMEQRGISPYANLDERVTKLVADSDWFEQVKSFKNRVVPIATKDFIEIRKQFLEKGGLVIEPPIDVLLNNLEKNGYDQSYAIEILKACFSKFDIPFFTIEKDRVHLDGKDLTKK